MAKRKVIIWMLLLILLILGLLFLLNFLIFKFILSNQPMIYNVVYEETWDNGLNGTMRPWTKQGNVAFSTECLEGKCAELFMRLDCPGINSGFSTPHSIVATDISDLNLTLTNQTRFTIDFKKPRTLLCPTQRIGVLLVDAYFKINNMKVYLFEPEWSFTGDGFQRQQPNVCTLSDLKPFVDKTWNSYDFTIKDLISSNEKCRETFSDQIDNNIETLEIGFFAISDSRANLIVDTIQILQ